MRRNHGTAGGAGVPLALALVALTAVAPVWALNAGAMPASVDAASANDVRSGTGAASEAAKLYVIAGGSLSDVLARFAAAAQVPLSFDPRIFDGQRSDGLSGRHSVTSGFAHLLAGSGYEAVDTGNRRYVLSRTVAARSQSEASSEPKDALAASLPAVTVTTRSGLATDLPEAYTGGLVARGGRLGLLGNADFMEMPFQMTSLTLATIESQQARSLGDVVGNNDASVRLIGNSESIGNGFSIRGFQYESNEVFFDGLPGIAPIWRVMPQFLERVEVLKGPNAVLNGATTSGSVGGAISMVPKRAGAEPLTRLTAGYISDTRVSGHVDIGRRFGRAREFGIRINAARVAGDGAKDNFRERSQQFALALDYSGPQLKVGLDLLHQRQVQHGAEWFAPNLDPAISQVPAAPPAERNWLQPWERADVREKIMALKGEYRISDSLSLYAGAGYNRSEQHYVTTRPTIADAAGTLLQTGMTWNTPYETATVEAGVRGALRTGTVSHSWNVGLTRLRHSFATGPSVRATTTPAEFSSNLYDPAVFPAPDAMPIPARPALNGQRNLDSVAVSDTMGFARDRLLLTFGLRKQNIETIDGVGSADRYDDSAITPMLAVLYKLHPYASVYANAIEGLSAGATAPPNAANAGETFAPFKAKQFEAGVKVDLNALAVTAAVFQIKRASGYLDLSTNRFSADGQQSNTGVELNVFGAPMRGLRLLGGISYIDAELARTAGGAYDGNTAPYQARTQINLGGEKDIDAIAGLALNARVIYTGSQYLDNANTWRIPASTRWDLGASYRVRVAGKHTTWRLGVENVTNRAYWLRNLHRGSPRTVMLSTTVDL